MGGHAVTWAVAYIYCADLPPFPPTLPSLFTPFLPPSLSTPSLPPSLSLPSRPEKYCLCSNYRPIQYTLSKNLTMWLSSHMKLRAVLIALWSTQHACMQCMAKSWLGSVMLPLWDFLHNHHHQVQAALLSPLMEVTPGLLRTFSLIVHSLSSTESQIIFVRLLHLWVSLLLTPISHQHQGLLLILITKLSPRLL